jgi:hypothetical protein
VPIDTRAQEVEAVDRAILTPLVRRLLDARMAEPVEWRHAPLGWMNIMEATLHRFSGTASIEPRGAVVPWSLILKVFRPPEPGSSANEPANWDYWRREADAYASGQLDELPGDITAPRCAGVVERKDGSIWVWMEELEEQRDEWPMSRYEQVARSVGRLNGGYVAGRPLPEVVGLGAGGLRSWVEELSATIHDDRDPASWQEELARRAIPDPDGVLRLDADAQLLLGVLDRLPQTFVHRDAWPANVLWRRATGGRMEPVAIDWMLCGRGAVGEDAAGIVGPTIWGFLVDVAHADELEGAVLRGYVAGLRDAGWDGPESSARLGYAATLALRFGLLVPWWAVELGKPSARDWLERKFGRPVPEIADGWGRMMVFVLRRADEARALAGLVPT